MRLTTIELNKEDQKFSVAHFTIFSDTHRERLHGHNYRVSLEFSSEVGENGMTSNYQLMKQKLRDLCRNLNEFTIIPRNSPYLKIQKISGKINVLYNNEEFSFPEADVLLLPIQNSTVEEFSFYLLEELCRDKELLKKFKIKWMKVGVASGPGQVGSSEWRHDE